MKNLIYLFALSAMIVGCRTRKPVKVIDVSRYSALHGLSNFRPNAILIIDGKPYNINVLYQISLTCVKNSYSRRGYQINGVTKLDSVNITTKNGVIVYQTPTEKENLAIEGALPTDQFFSRIRQKKEDGSFYDKVIVRASHLSYLSRNISIKSKACVIIGDSLYSEKDLRKLDIDFRNKLSKKRCTVGGPFSFTDLKFNLSKYEAIFKFDTADAVNNITKPQ
jgi:hypothetical protein